MSASVDGNDNNIYTSISSGGVQPQQQEYFESELGLKRGSAEEMGEKISQLKDSLAQHFSNGEVGARAVLHATGSYGANLQSLLGAGGNNEVLNRLAAGEALSSILGDQSIRANNDTLQLAMTLSFIRGSIEQQIQTVNTGGDAIAQGQEADAALKVLASQLQPLAMIAAREENTGADLATILINEEDLAASLRKTSTTAGSDTITTASSSSTSTASSSTNQLSSHTNAAEPPPVSNSASNPYIRPSAAAEIAILMGRLVDLNIELGMKQHEFLVTIMENIQENATVQGRIQELMRDLEKQEAQAAMVASIMSLAGSVLMGTMMFGPKAYDAYKDRNTQEVEGAGPKPEPTTTKRSDPSSSDSSVSDASKLEEPREAPKKSEEELTVTPKKDDRVDDGALSEGDIENELDDPTQEGVTIAPQHEESNPLTATSEVDDGDASVLSRSSTESDFDLKEATNKAPEETLEISPQNEAQEVNPPLQRQGGFRGEFDSDGTLQIEPQANQNEPNVSRPLDADPSTSSSSADPTKAESSASKERTERRDPKREVAEHRRERDQSNLQTGQLLHNIFSEVGKIYEASEKARIADERKEVEMAKALSEGLSQILSTSLQHASSDTAETQNRINQLVETLSKLSQDQKRMSEMIIQLQG